MNHRRFAYYLLLIGCALPILLLSVILFTGQREISASENRALAKFPVFSLNSFMDGSYQADLEKALGDQYPGGERIKGFVLDAQNAVTKAETALLSAFAAPDARIYTEIAPGYYHFAGDEHRIVERPWAEGNDMEKLRRAAEPFNRADNVRKYLYFVRNSRSQDFTEPSSGNPVFDHVCAAYHADGYGCFSAADYQEYCRLFYQTDHHWNAQGADRAYRELVALLGIADEPIQVEGELSFDVVFNGSYARQTKDLCADEKFSVLTYSLPPMKLTLNGKRGQYGHQSLYEKNRYPVDELRNHYAYYYGGDFGEIIIENPRKDAGRLLVLADSYSNPLNLLLASHYSQTFIIDLRYYQRDMGQAFDLDQYIAEHQADTLLMLGDIALFADAQEEEAGI